MIKSDLKDWLVIKCIILIYKTKSNEQIKKKRGRLYSIKYYYKNKEEKLVKPKLLIFNLS